MSVQRFLPTTHPEAWFANSLREQPCYYCGAPLNSPFIVWAGAGAEHLTLHPACTVELAIRLFRDVWQIECETTYVTARTTTELRERLIGEEWRR
jgi:hypothetical protein